jgi:putative MFS transporter
VQTLFAQGVPAILFTLSSELVPTPVRTLGLGIISGMGRFGAVLGPFILGLFLHFGTKISDIIYLFAIPLFVASILALFVIKIDPRGQSLEQIGKANGEAVAAQHTK